MSIERLRALVQSWREIADKHDARAERLNESGDASDAAWCEAAAEHRSYCADELATLIAELGQEVGAVDFPPELKDRVDRLEKAAKNASSPAHTSEAMDVVVTDAMVERAMNARIPGGSQAWVWLFNCAGGMAPEDRHRDFFRRVLDAAMRQEGGSDE